MSKRGSGRTWQEVTPWEILLMVVEGVLFLAQVVLCILFYNHAGLVVVLVLGWALLAVALVLGWRARVAFQEKGGVPEDESWVHTAAVVDTGVYGLVRHPMYLSFQLISLALICLAQHWLCAVLGALLILLLYSDMVREEVSTLARFGEAYQEYMHRVPRMNLVAGAIRAWRRKSQERGEGA